MSTTSADSGLSARPLLSLWSTPLGVHRWARAQELNPLLARVLGSLRAVSQPQPVPFFASEDDLLERIRLPEWQDLVRFVVDSLHATVAQANHGAWPQPAPALQVHLRGMWFQIANQGASHDVHTHGNCSWSGVYCVQVDEHARRVADPVLGEHNGVTRFYGPYFPHLGGAHADLGNAYLQSAHLDIAPRPGQLIVFPSWLAHQALAYRGEIDRIIVSFNASVHAARGGDRLRGYAAA